MLYSPWYLLLLLFVPVLAWRLFSPRRRSAVRFSSLRIAQQMTPTLRQRLAWLPAALTLGAITFMVLGAARPREGREQTVAESEGIAIEMVVDRSGSMQALDFEIDGEPVDRLTAIKKVASEFVQGDDSRDLAGRFSDLVGLITFAGYADSETPPTLDHAFLTSRLNHTQIVTARSEDGTAIGDAISLAVEKLNALDERQKQKVQSKVIILLTDGENNAGQLEPVPAAELAATMGIKVYTIGVGTKGEAPIPAVDAFGRRTVQWMRVNIDEATLTEVAEVTGGKYFRATDTDSLAKIYEEIDQLEKTNVEAKHFVDYRELAVQSYSGAVFFPAVLMIAFVLLVARLLLQQTWLREMTA
ncbi:vWA domain-containing protein [Allorhodopirellula heiligendammensis]|uniref:von Willebrand factor type A domain protein n=1 Tax=Allorhodopirellula heiligendammensis TaxID=2714739 RepID=A0A5C6C4V0_9BACT|nr:VWA domain-containing protein [Allorhodopirellula heiligendammensis]TWU19640.1 von Willebrand factor type A domain protein [Allorhodopirellula heiligendammensis]|tara:strand:+ start:1667 stop:2740 length:1074 start_codon:yes stop_codon:yes gene_type:complete